MTKRLAILREQLAREATKPTRAELVRAFEIGDHIPASHLSPRGVKKVFPLDNRDNTLAGEIDARIHDLFQVTVGPPRSSFYLDTAGQVHQDEPNLPNVDHLRYYTFSASVDTFDGVPLEDHARILKERFSRLLRDIYGRSLFEAFGRKELVQYVERQKAASDIHQHYIFDPTVRCYRLENEIPLDKRAFYAYDVNSDLWRRIGQTFFRTTVRIRGHFINLKKPQDYAEYCEEGALICRLNNEGKIIPMPWSTGSSTGRITSNKPALQELPKATDTIKRQIDALAHKDVPRGNRLLTAKEINEMTRDLYSQSLRNQCLNDDMQSLVDTPAMQNYLSKQAPTLSADYNPLQGQAIPPPWASHNPAPWAAGAPPWAYRTPAPWEKKD